MVAPKTLGARIAQARRELAVREHRDILLAEIAAAVGVTSTSVSEWEADKKVPREDALARLAKVLGTTPAWLRYGIGHEKPPAQSGGLVPDPSRHPKLTEGEVQASRERVAAKKKTQESPKKKANGRRQP